MKKTNVMSSWILSAGDEKFLDFFVFKLTKVWALLDPDSSGFWTFIVQIF